MGYKILLVEDEADIAEPIRAGLSDEGFNVEIASTGQIAMRRMVDHWDLVILDLMLPDFPGEAILNNLKQLPNYPAVLILTARGAIQDKLSLFRQGCDDYLVKPVIYDELLERVKALLRRSNRVDSGQYYYEDLKLDPETLRLSTDQKQILLTPKEGSILRLFLSSPGKVISRIEILQNVWGLREEPNTNFIGVHMFNLRKKLSEVERESWLHTVRRSGFVFSKEGEF
jgi:DNA-binding response OmpR family regulator